MSELFAGVTLAVVALIVVFIGPALTVWSLEALFSLGLELNVKTYFAALWFHALLISKIERNK